MATGIECASSARAAGKEKWLAKGSVAISAQTAVRCGVPWSAAHGRGSGQLLARATSRVARTGVCPANGIAEQRIPLALDRSSVRPRPVESL